MLTDNDDMSVKSTFGHVTAQLATRRHQTLSWHDVLSVLNQRSYRQ